MHSGVGVGGITNYFLQHLVYKICNKISLTSSSGRLIEGLMALSLFILPPPKPALLAAGVLDKGYDKVLVLRTKKFTG